MPVALSLNEAQMDVFNAALKSKKVAFKVTGRTIHLTAENWQDIRDAVQELHLKKYKIKTKTVEHLETCYYAQQILEKIGTAASAFPATNDNTVGLVVDNTTEETVADEDTSTLVSEDDNGSKE